MTKIDPRVERILLTHEQINNACQKMAERINRDYKDKSPILIGVLKGCLPFYSNLFLRLTCEPTMDFMTISSYSGSQSVGLPKIVMDLKQSITNRHVIVVEDIVDTGKTLKTVVELLKGRKPKSIKVACLTDKKERREVFFEPDYVAFDIPNVFAVGYGLDYNECYRNLPYIGELKKKYIKETNEK